VLQRNSAREIFRVGYKQCSATLMQLTPVCEGGLGPLTCSLTGYSPHLHPRLCALISVHFLPASPDGNTDNRIRFYLLPNSTLT
jgi:hypothetical protein